MNPLSKIKISSVTLFLATVTVAFQVYVIVYVFPYMTKIMQETDKVARLEMAKSFALNVPLILIFLVGVISTLVLPLHFFIKNRTVIRKWLMIVMALAVYFLNLYLLLAVFCLFIYLGNVWQEFMAFRRSGS